MDNWRVSQLDSVRFESTRFTAEESTQIGTSCPLGHSKMLSVALYAASLRQKVINAISHCLRTLKNIVTFNSLIMKMEDIFVIFINILSSNSKIIIRSILYQHQDSRNLEMKKYMESI